VCAASCTKSDLEPHDLRHARDCRWLLSRATKRWCGVKRVAESGECMETWGIAAPCRLGPGSRILMTAVCIAHSAAAVIWAGNIATYILYISACLRR